MSPRTSRGVRPEDRAAHSDDWSQWARCGGGWPGLTTCCLRHQGPLRSVFSAIVGPPLGEDNLDQLGNLEVEDAAADRARRDGAG